MPTPAYLSIEGEKQGKISAGAMSTESLGGKSQDAHKDEIYVQAFEHVVDKPVEKETGQPTGPRVHRPMVITKEFDKSSPLLYNALVTGETMKTCELKWYRTSREGKQEHYFTMKLTDAIVTKIHAYMPNCLDENNKSLTHLEDVSFSYRKIEWKHEKASTVGADDFAVPPE